MYKKDREAAMILREDVWTNTTHISRTDISLPLPNLNWGLQLAKEIVY